MLGLGKKKKNEKQDASETDKPKSPEKQKDQDESKAQDEKIEKKRKRFPIKKIIFILAVLMAVGASAFAVYTLYLTPKDSDGSKPTYKIIELNHINLPEEMVRFCYDYFFDLYIAMLTFNKEMTLIDKKIAEIDEISKKYPDQKKISDKEKKSWEKESNTLKKSFLKIEKPVKEIYVLFAVNKEQGLVQIQIRAKELSELGQNALIPVQERTQVLKSDEKIPQGFIKGNIYKLKKKFL